VGMVLSFPVIAFPKIPHSLEQLPPIETPRASFIPAQGNALGLEFGPLAQSRQARQPGGLPEGSRWSFGERGGTTTGKLVLSSRTPEGCQNSRLLTAATSRFATSANIYAVVAGLAPLQGA